MATVTEIESVVKRLFGGVRRPSKNAAKALDQAEERLGLSLPRMLRDFGLRFGWNGPLASMTRSGELPIVGFH